MDTLSENMTPNVDQSVPITSKGEIIAAPKAPASDSAVESDDQEYTREKIIPLVNSFLVQQFHVKNKDNFKLPECKEEMKHVSDRYLKIAMDLLVADKVISVPEGRSRIPTYNIINAPPAPVEEEEDSIADAEGEAESELEEENATVLVDKPKKVPRERTKRVLPVDDVLTTVHDSIRSPIKKVKREKKVSKDEEECSSQVQTYQVEVCDLGLDDTLASLGMTTNRTAIFSTAVSTGRQGNTTTITLPETMCTSFPEQQSFARPTLPSSTTNTTIKSKIISTEERDAQRAHEELSLSIAHLLLQAEEEFSLDSFVADILVALPTAKDESVRSILKEFEAQNRIFCDGDTVYKV